MKSLSKRLLAITVASLIGAGLLAATTGPALALPPHAHSAAMGLTTGPVSETTVQLMWTNPEDAKRVGVAVAYTWTDDKGKGQSGGGDLDKSASVNGPVKATVASLRPGIEYTFAITSKFNDRSQDLTSGKTSPTYTAPAPVTDVKATATGTQVVLSWVNPASLGNFAGVEIRRKEGSTSPKSPNDGDKVGTPAATTAANGKETFTDPAVDLKANHDYAYAVFSRNADSTAFSDRHTKSNTVKVTTGAPSTPVAPAGPEPTPGKPDKLASATASASRKSITISWAKLANSTLKVKVARIQDGKRTALNDVSGSSFTDSAIKTGVPYSYELVVTDGKRNSDPLVTTALRIDAARDYKVPFIIACALAALMAGALILRTRMNRYSPAPAQPTIPAVSSKRPSDAVVTSAVATSRIGRGTPNTSVGGTQYAKQVPVVLPTEVVLDATTGTAMAHGTAGRFEVRAASVRGLDHASSGDAGDDVALVVHRPDVLFAVVSDGMGSQAGSRFVAKAIIDGFTKAFADPGKGPQQALQSGVANAGKAAAALVKAQGSGAATIIAAALVPHAGGTTVHAACIGDSGLFTRSATQVAELLGDEDDGGGTRGMPQHTDATFESFEVPLTDVVFLASDGFHTALLDPKGELAAHLQKNWATAPRPVDFLDAVSFDGDYYYDDRSVVAAWRTQGN